MTPTPSTPPPPHMHGEHERRPKMTTTTAELEVLRQARLAEVINRVLSEAPETRKPRRRSQIDLANCGEQIGTCICI